MHADATPLTPDIADGGPGHDAPRAGHHGAGSGSPVAR
jgi:hypothetical protein